MLLTDQDVGARTRQFLDEHDHRELDQFGGFVVPNSTSRQLGS
jgi:hypothetical protein